MPPSSTEASALSCDRSLRLERSLTVPLPERYARPELLPGSPSSRGSRALATATSPRLVVDRLEAVPRHVIPIIEATATTASSLLVTRRAWELR